VIVRPLTGDVLAMSPPFVITNEQIDRIVSVLDRAITRVEKELKTTV
jgi:adenosylmethionine-8-amino-7-oxononanoate aminotransferase